MSYKTLRGMTGGGVTTTAATGAHVTSRGGTDNLQGGAFFGDARFGVNYFVHIRQPGEFGVSLFNDCVFAEDEPAFQAGRFNLSHFNDCRFQ